jgi:hypothetical protein
LLRRHFEERGGHKITAARLRVRALEELLKHTGAVRDPGKIKQS